MSSVKNYFLREGLIIAYYTFFLLLFLGAFVFPLSSDFSIIYNSGTNEYSFFLSLLCYFSYGGFLLLGYGYYIFLLLLAIILLRPLLQIFFYKKKLLMMKKRRNVFFVLCILFVFIFTPLMFIGMKGEIQAVEHFRLYGLVGQFFLMFIDGNYDISYNVGFIVLLFSVISFFLMDYFSFFRIIFIGQLLVSEEKKNVETNYVDESITINEPERNLFEEEPIVQEQFRDTQEKEEGEINYVDESIIINESEPIVQEQFRDTEVEKEQFVINYDEVNTKSDDNNILKGEKEFDNSRECDLQDNDLENSYILPKISLLDKVVVQENKNISMLEKQQESLQEALQSFKVRATCIDYISGPRVTLFRILPKAGQTVSRFNSLESDLARTLKATAIRILSPIPGDDKVGIEIPNQKSTIVSFSSMIISQEWKKQRKEDIPIVLGRDVTGNNRFMSLADAPHLLIAGSTGAGKSIFINTLILSLLFRYSPDELKLILIDPKQVELSFFSKLPHLLSPILKNPEKVPASLGWAVYEMNKRYSQLEKMGVKKLVEYNLVVEQEKRLPFIVIIIDELADLMMSVGKNIEPMIAQIAQKARAVGIHLILATQRPSTDVLTGTIKNNFPTRIAFKVTSYTDSMTILNQKGAEKLLGKGDLLFLKNDCMRVQASLIENDEVRRVVDFCAEQAAPSFISIEPPEGSIEAKETEVYGQKDFSRLSGEELFEASIDILRELKSNGLENKLSVSYMQRSMRIGYNKSANLMESLEKRSVIGPSGIKGKRKIFLNDDE